jgi:hypothetical protein
MAKFLVEAVFEIPARELFVLAGDVTEGEIRAGMTVRVRLNSSLSMSEPIHAIEPASTDSGPRVCLCIKADEEARELWRSLGIGDEVVEVV